jgi:hypothetical protein
LPDRGGGSATSRLTSSVPRPRLRDEDRVHHGDPLLTIVVFALVGGCGSRTLPSLSTGEAAATAAMASSPRRDATVARMVAVMRRTAVMAGLLR